MKDQALRIDMDEQTRQLSITGPLDIYHYTEAEKALAAHAARAASIDLSGVTKLDTAGVLLLNALHTRHKKLTFENIAPEYEGLVDLVSDAKIGKTPKVKKPSALVQSITSFGAACVGFAQEVKEFIRFIGLAFIALGRVIRHPSRLRTTSIIHHIEVVGIDAIPIISLVAFIISVVLAYQGQVQLKPLGAQQYTVNLIAISVLREMGVLLTAIMVAGRSGSAFAASIGVMKVRDEVDALRTIGFDPFELLVLPRMLALLIALPLLTFIADMMGLFGGAVISWALLDISFLQYFEQARHALKWQDFFVGMIKAPVFALMIALVGCRHGLKVSGSSESVGKETTAAVVEAIFLVLLLDGLFSVYFSTVGL